MLPPTFHRPPSASAVGKYIATVSAWAPHTPLYYYHFPAASGVPFPASRILQDALGMNAATLRGIKFTDVRARGGQAVC